MSRRALGLVHMKCPWYLSAGATWGSELGPRGQALKFGRQEAFEQVVPWAYLQYPGWHPAARPGISIFWSLVSKKTLFLKTQKKDDSSKGYQKVTFVQIL